MIWCGVGNVEWCMVPCLDHHHCYLGTIAHQIISMKNAGQIFLLSLLLRLVACDVFTALVEMEELLDTETLLMNSLETYIKEEDTKLESLRRHLHEFRTEHNIAQQNVQQYLNNPINAYLLTKRLTSNWKEVESIVEKDVGKEFIANMTTYRSENMLKFPTDEDLNGAATALMRLQDTYMLNASSVARGELNGVQYSTRLTSHDCFELGRQSYQNKDFYHTVVWMTEAMERYLDEKNKTTSKPEILEYLAFSTYKQGDIHAALQMTNELLELQPNHERALGNKIYYEGALVGGIEEAKKKDEDLQVDKMDDPVMVKYHGLCRSEGTVPEKIKAMLKCRYTDKGKGYLKIGPLKEEEAYLDPRIVLYHDVIFDDEIEVIKRMAVPRFKRATVQNSQTGKLETADYRISKSSWLEDEEHEYVRNVGRRSELMTGLTATTAESLQVVNYGIGGHYDAHYDFARKGESAFENFGFGNRIATVLFYMSDVEQGGATVFPLLGVSLIPKKGAAAVWMNLLPNGDGDLWTRHAACPVLIGSKWVCNRWFHEKGQEFLRPCNLTQDGRD